ncbi:hypothetical protein MCHIJ_34640 [Mycolicibacterium chitae]|uniref:FHA domain-containing protein n=2 Tax=Mycolicibacterium chitae TaxID=1792 RepID=A0A3S4T067_MYCCI|nr:hypothetical protein [Mycolicibacterium chitae]BBZ04027.1 hypothetical protein MCHIJ_34640 [Mycolicibacterium chitae]VEG47678.1 FHA domain-containing protein [Mycolicibacterium chitae]
MKTKRTTPASKGSAKTRKPARRPQKGTDPRELRRAESQRRREQRRPADPQARSTRTRDRDPRGLRHGPATSPSRRPVRPKNTNQAKARAKARKAKAPKVVRVPLRERILTRISSIDLNPRTLAARVPFVVLVIGALGMGLGVTLWLSTDAAERSYELGTARKANQVLLQQKEALERDVLEAQAAPALAEAARNLGMIPSRNTAHLVQDPAGNWIVVGEPKPAEGVPPPPLNTPLPDPAPPRAPETPRTVEQPVRVPAAPAPPEAPAVPLAGDPAVPLAGEPAAVPAPGVNPEVPVRNPEPVLPQEHVPAVAAPGPAVPGQPTLPGPTLGPEPGPVEAPAVALPEQVPAA